MFGGGSFDATFFSRTDAQVRWRMVNRTGKLAIDRAVFEALVL